MKNGFLYVLDHVAVLLMKTHSLIVSEPCVFQLFVQVRALEEGGQRAGLCQMLFLAWEYVLHSHFYQQCVLSLLPVRR